MPEQRVNEHSVSRLTARIVWSTKYRYSVLEGDIQLRCRTILIQICESENVIILKGVVPKDHMHIEYRPSLILSYLIKKLKGRSPIYWHCPNTYDQSPYSSIRKGDWKLIYHHVGHKLELFNVYY
jgi:REP element-mobilizing transposase RayT